MALPTVYTPPKNEGELDKRKLLGQAVWKMALGDSAGTADSLVKEGEKLGVSRNQLSNLYQQYKSSKDIAGSLGSPNQFANDFEFAEERRKLDIRNKQFEKEERVEEENKKNAEFFNRPSALTRYDKNTGEPVRGVQGAVGGLSRGTSPTGGTPIGGGGRSSLPKEMQNIAAANLYRAGQQRAMQNEQIALDREEQRARIDAFLRMNKPPEGGEIKQMPFIIK